MISALIGEDHDQIARWALVPLAPRGWGVVFFRRADAERLIGWCRFVTVGTARHALTLGPAVTRLRAPPALAPGRYRVSIDAVTPVAHRSIAHGPNGVVLGHRATTRPTAATILTAASHVIERLAVRAQGTLHVASVACETQAEKTFLGGYIQRETGWVGRVEVECNAPAAWALLCAQHTGLGGAVAFGLGRVRVRAEALS